MNCKSDGYFRGIRWLHGDEVEPPQGLARGGIYHILRDNKGWLVGWVPAEAVDVAVSFVDVGTCIGGSDTLAGVKVIAEHDYKLRRQAR